MLIRNFLHNLINSQPKEDYSYNQQVEGSGEGGIINYDCWSLGCTPLTPTFTKHEHYTFHCFYFLNYSNNSLLKFLLLYLSLLYSQFLFHFAKVVNFARLETKNFPKFTHVYLFRLAKIFLLSCEFLVIKY